MLLLTLEVHIPTPSQDWVLLALAPALDHLVIPTLIPTCDRHHIPEEAKGRVVPIVLGQGHMVITVQGQDHPHTEGTIHVQGLQYVEASLPLNTKNTRREEKGMRMKEFPMLNC